MTIKEQVKLYLQLEDAAKELKSRMEILKDSIQNYIKTRPLRGIAVKRSERIVPKWKEEFEKLAGSKFPELEKKIKETTPPSVSETLVIDKEVFSEE